MNTTGLLDHYRTDILQDAAATRLLVLLYRDGNLVEEDISRRTHLDNASLKSLLTRLFRASLVQLLENDIWGLTDLTKMLLAKLGFAELATLSTLSKLALTDLDLDLIKASVQMQAENDWKRSSTINAFCRTLASYLEVGDTATLQSLQKTRVTRALTVGIDPSLHRLGPRRYLDLLMNWHQSRQSDWWFVVGQHANDATIKNYRRLCSLAAKDIRTSDSQLFTSASNSPLNTSVRNSAVLVSALRVVAALTADTEDEVIGQAFLSKTALSEQFLHMLKDHSQNTYEQIRLLLIYTLRPDIPKLELKQLATEYPDEADRRIRSTFTADKLLLTSASWQEVNDSVWGRSTGPANTQKGTSRIPPKSTAEAVLLQLNAIGSLLNSSQPHAFTPQEIQRICVELEVALNGFRALLEPGIQANKAEKRGGPAHTELTSSQHRA